MSETVGIEYLRKKLEKVQPRAETRYKQYDMKYQEATYGITIPASVRRIYRSTIGWCAKAVDALADRLVFRGFANDQFDLMSIFQVNSPDIFFDSAILSALISSCCFVYISEDDNLQRFQIIEGTNATGVIDPITYFLKEGYAVLKRDDQGNPVTEAYFLPEKTEIYRNGKKSESESKIHACPYPLLVPIIHRPDAKRPFGRARITRAAEYWQAYAKRTLERADITAEFYSFPQKWVVGTSQNMKKMDTWKATVASMLEFTKDEDGDSPNLGQFTAPSMAPFVDQLRIAAAGFASETGLTLDDLGFVSDNPSSSEAIKASHETLRTMARKAQRCFGAGFLNVGILAACLRDNFPYNREVFYDTEPKWQPVFEADAAALSLVGDGALKLNQAIPGYFDEDKLKDLTGI
jgi:hypothetical protein